jgi:hypothetical protein
MVRVVRVDTVSSPSSVTTIQVEREAQVTGQITPPTYTIHTDALSTLTCNTVCTVFQVEESSPVPSDLLYPYCIITYRDSALNVDKLGLCFRPKIC